MGESKAADIVDKLVRAVRGKFNGLDFDICRRTAQHAPPRSGEYYRREKRSRTNLVIQQRGRTPTCQSPAITISRGQQQQGSGDDTPTRDEDEDQEGEQHGKHHGFTPTSSATARFSQRIPATTAVPTSILWSMGSDIENAEEIKAWHQNIWMLFNYLFLRIAGVATSFLLRYKPKSGEIPNGKAAWDCMIA